jgi:hypothetical protein
MMLTRSGHGAAGGQDLLLVTARVDDDGFFAERVADQRAVALQGANGKDERYGWFSMTDTAHN